MTVKQIRPNGTLVTGSAITITGGTNQGIVAGDNSDSTYMSRSGVAPNTVCGFSMGAHGLSNVKLKQWRTAIRGYCNSTEQISAIIGDDSAFYSYLYGATAPKGTTTVGTSYSAWAPASNAPMGGQALTLNNLSSFRVGIEWEAQTSSSDASRVTEVWWEVDYYANVGAPTAVIPASGAAVTVPNPTLGATATGSGDGQKQTITWYIAKDAAFTQSLKVIQGTASVVSGAVTTTPTTAQLDLSPGTWYIRARGIDEYGYPGAYSAATTFTVSHGSTAINQTPTGGKVLQWAATTPFAWTFSDPSPSDTQSAYQIIVQRNSDGLQIADTGKVTSTSKTANVAIPNTYIDVDLRWRIQTWDSGNATAGYTNWQVFKLSSPPTVTVTSPASGEVISTGQPTVTWTTDAGTSQAQRQVTIRQTSNNALVYQSTMTTTTSQTWTAPQSILLNNVGYTVSVTVVDQDGLSAVGSQNFSTSFVAPDPVTFFVDGSGYEDAGYINIDWSQQQQDPYFVQWNVYRRMAGTSDWALLASYSNVNTRTYHDWSATTGDTFEYGVSQSGGRYGTVLEGPITPSAQVQAAGSHYWLINPYNEADNLKLDHVTGDDYTDEYEEEVINLIGRGRKLNQGTRFGYTGSLTAELRDDLNLTARAKRMKLQIIKANKVTLYLRNPFGDYLMVSLGNLAISRVKGVGTAEFVDVSIPYYEVA